MNEQITQNETYFLQRIGDTVKMCNGSFRALNMCVLMFQRPPRLAVFDSSAMAFAGMAFSTLKSVTIDYSLSPPNDKCFSVSHMSNTKGLFCLVLLFFCACLKSSPN